MSQNPYRWINPSCSAPGMPPPNGMAPSRMPPHTMIPPGMVHHVMAPPMQYNHRFNPNAAAFVPRGQVANNHYNGQMNNQFPPYAPPYANNTMYGANREMPHYYHNDLANPAMASYYGEESSFGFDQFGYNQTECYVPSPEVQEKMRKCEENATEINEIIVGLEQLQQSAEDFQSWFGAIRERISLPKMTEEGKKVALLIACEMAINVIKKKIPSADDHHSQYTIAKLFAFLSDIPGLTSGCILPTLEQLHWSSNTFNPEKKANLLIFFAELFNRLDSEVCGKKILPLGQALMQLMEDSLKTPHDSSMKVLIQVLKIAGFDLDSTSKGYEQMNEFLTRFGGYAGGHPRLSESVKAQMLDVIEQRTKGWGRPPRDNVTEEEGDFMDVMIDIEESKRRVQAPPTDTDTSIDDADVQQEYDSFMNEEVDQTVLRSMIKSLNMDDNSEPPNADS